MKNFLSKKLMTLLLSVTCSCSISYAQDNASNFWNNVRYGGNVGLNFSNGFTAIQLAPQAIYQVNPFVGIGAGLNGSYVKRNFDRRDGFNDGLDFTSTILGGSVIGIFQPIREIQLSSDFEVLNVNRNFEDDQFIDDNFWVPALYLGAGYANGPVVIGVRYDVLFNENRSVFRNGLQPFVRVLF